MKKDFKTISILVLIIFSIQSCNRDEKRDKKVNEPTKTTILDKNNFVEICVEYDSYIDCEKCPKWMLIESDYKELNKKNAERIYVKNKQNSKMNELNALYEKQRPLVVKLKGEYKIESLNKHRVFEFSKFTIVEL
jgi:hypothetical protein